MHRPCQLVTMEWSHFLRRKNFNMDETDGYRHIWHDLRSERPSFYSLHSDGRGFMVWDGILSDGKLTWHLFTLQLATLDTHKYWKTFCFLVLTANMGWFLVHVGQWSDPSQSVRERMIISYRYASSSVVIVLVKSKFYQKYMKIFGAISAWKWAKYD